MPSNAGRVYGGGERRGGTNTRENLMWFCAESDGRNGRQRGGKKTVKGEGGRRYQDFRERARSSGALRHEGDFIGALIKG